MFLSCVVSVSLIILFVLPANALFDNDVKKAKEFMTAGMYPQAIELLNKRINEKPTDAEAHFQLGVCYINTGNYSGADARFGSAVKLKSDYGYQIGEKYKKVGDEALNKGNTGQAQSLYQMAVQYQPDLKDGIVKETFSQGKGFFEKGQYDVADRSFSVATSFDSSLKRTICDMYFNLGQSANYDECVALYRRATTYGSWHNKEIGERFLTISKSKTSEKESQRWKKMASAYIEVPPDYKIYQPGTYNFSLKAGEMTDHWIMFPAGRQNKYDVSSTAGKFILKFDDGTTTKSWSSDPWPSKRRLKFKITAVEVDQIVTLYVK